MPPNWVWLAFFVPVLLHQLWAEEEAVKVLLPCYKRHMDLHRLEDGFSLMGLLPSSETLWLRAQKLLLVMSSVDVFTDTYFASTMGLGGTNACSHGRTQEIWDFWWRQSIFSSLPFVVPLDVLISASWTLMLLHLVVACATMVRKKGAGDRGDDGRSPPLLSCSDKDTLFNDDVCFQLGESAGFSSVVQMSNKLYVLQMKKNVYRKKGYRIMGYGLPLSQKYVRRVYFSYLLEDGVQVVLQSWTLAINTHQARELALLPALSLALSFLMGLGKMKEMLWFFQVRRLMEDMAFRTRAENNEVDRAGREEEFEAGLKVVGCHAMLVGLAVFLMAGALFIACFTLYAAHACPGGIRSLNGCVDIP
ncbi:unnamed protein product [Symbiodinium natans]|uniref:Uncharacterized protein n=1 Tax=Symbiodinium natans TaxID=878477 RepID=A0A812H773_9DINO|nr:unnamed protein product [Symbiodinium natans]